MDKLKLAMQAQGAVNVRALVGTLHTWLKEENIYNDFHKEIPLHIRLLLGQVNFLLGQGMGPSFEDLVEAEKLLKEGAVA
jgi:hypothetical protein